MTDAFGETPHFDSLSDWIKWCDSPEGRKHMLTIWSGDFERACLTAYYEQMDARRAAIIGDPT